MALPIEQLCRQQRFSDEHPEWRILAQNWGQHYIAALDDLDRAHGQVYDLAVAQDRWIACDLGTGRWLVAPCAAELRRLIVADSAAG